MDELLGLLGKVNKELDDQEERIRRGEESIGIKNEIEREIEKAYIFYALNVCRDKLDGKDMSSSKEGVFRTREMTAQLHSLEM